MQSILPILIQRYLWRSPFLSLPLQTPYPENDSPPLNLRTRPGLRQRKFTRDRGPAAWHITVHQQGPKASLSMLATRNDDLHKTDTLKYSRAVLWEGTGGY